LSEELKPLYDKKVQCPICAFLYSTKKVRSRFIRVEKIESDFFTVYKNEGVNPLFYEINVCPNCGYSFSDTYTNTFSANAIAAIKNQITAKWRSRDYSDERSIEQAIETYKLALLSGSLKQEKNINLAGICLRLSWLYRLQNDIVQEKRFMKVSLEKYKSSYIEANYMQTQMTEMRLLYLIGELSRRLGLREEAVKYFSRVIKHPNRLYESKLVEMAREQWYVIREQDKLAD
jgi:uncharacterized protein